MPASPVRRGSEGRLANRLWFEPTAQKPPGACRSFLISVKVMFTNPAQQLLLLHPRGMVSVQYEHCCAGAYLLSCLLMHLVYGQEEVEDEKGSCHLLFLFFQSSRHASSNLSNNQSGVSITHSCNFSCIFQSGTSGRSSSGGNMLSYLSCALLKDSLFMFILR